MQAPNASRPYPLAPMSGGIRALTLFFLALPVVVAGLALLLPGATALLAVAGFLVLVTAGVWLGYRPQGFALTPAELVVEFPVRRRAFGRHDVTSARVVPSAELRRRLGFALRVGVGGLFGGFGWLWSRRLGWVEMYISRTNGLVWIERAGGHPLLLSPEHPERFAAELEARGAEA